MKRGRKKGEKRNRVKQRKKECKIWLITTKILMSTNSKAVCCLPTVLPNKVGYPMGPLFFTFSLAAMGDQLGPCFLPILAEVGDRLGPKFFT
jgi:hypothetical protein